MTQIPPPKDKPATEPFPTGPEIRRAQSAGSDSLAHLHKMSTTAGLGSQEYVAVNVTAIVAVLFGLASVLALIGYLLLIIPLVGIILSLLALAQIRDSNGTQTGRGFAWIGLVLAAGMCIGVVGYQGAQILRSRNDARQISELTHQFGQRVAEKRFDEAYALFDSNFQKRFSLNDFKNRLASMQAGKYLPPIDGIEWNGLAVFQDDGAGEQTAEAMVKLHYKGLDGEEREPARYRRSGNVWLIDNLPGMFAAPPKPGDRED